MNDPISLAVIGGSGLYELPGLQGARPIEVDTPFGATSAPIVVGELDGKRIAFLARHGLGHRLTPSEVPYRANIFALKLLGAERILSISACGSLREELAPGEIVIPDQLFDFTRKRQSSFFGEGVVAHLSTAAPFCPELSALLAEASRAAGGKVHRGGTFITIEGPRFSTKAESNVFRSWGMSLIGMTTAPEAFLAREAEMCYAVMAHVTDYDVWHETVGPVTVGAVVETLERNTALAREGIRRLLRDLPPSRSCDCATAMEGAVITRPDAVSRPTIDKLAPLLARRTTP